MQSVICEPTDFGRAGRALRPIGHDPFLRRIATY